MGVPSESSAPLPTTDHLLIAAFNYNGFLYVNVSQDYKI